MVAERLLLPEDADRELRLLLNDMLKSGALPLRGSDASLPTSARK
jgi:hypothetical protein